MSIPDTDLTNLQNSINTWTTASAQPGNDYSELMAQIKAVLATMNPNDPQSISRAYMMFAGPIMIQAMNYQADNLGALGATLNINSDLQAFITDMQNDATFIANNSGTPASGTQGQPGYVPAVAQTPEQVTECQAAANDLAQKLCDLANILPNQTTDPTYDFNNSWISSTTDSSLVKSITNLSQLLVGNDISQPVTQEYLQEQIGTPGVATLGNYMDASINSWSQNPIPPIPTTPGQSPPTGVQGSQQMQNLYQYFTQGNNAVSTQNNATQALIQQESASFTQFEGITSKGLTEISSLNSAEVKKLSGG